MLKAILLLLFIAVLLGVIAAAALLILIGWVETHPQEDEPEFDEDGEESA